VNGAECGEKNPDEQADDRDGNQEIKKRKRATMAPSRAASLGSCFDASHLFILIDHERLHEPAHTV